MKGQMTSSYSVHTQSQYRLVLQQIAQPHCEVWDAEHDEKREEHVSPADYAPRPKTGAKGVSAAPTSQ